MGSGKDAAMTSRLCVTFLSKLLSAGCPMSVVLELLNGFLRSRGGECFASIDLAELDLLSGKGCFVKSGAAPSYILRDNNLFKLQSKTLPIGILKDTDAEVINFELKENDIIVMFSDGVASCLEDSVWLTGLLCFELENDLDKMAKKILEYAKKEVAKADDMTVALMRVTKRTRIPE
jgi:stage II sporulation protein E